MLFTKSEQKTWLNLLAPLRYSNRYLLLLLLKLTFCPKVSYSKSLTLVLSIFGLVCMATQTSMHFENKKCPVYNATNFFDNLFNDTTSCFFSGTLGLYNFLTSLKCFLIPTFVSFFKVWDSKVFVHWISARPGRLIKRNFSKIFMRSHLSKFSIRLSIRLIKVCVQFHCTKDLSGRTGRVLV